MIPATPEQAREDIRFLRTLLLRADPDWRGQARLFALWGLVWALGYGAEALLPPTGATWVGLAVWAALLLVLVVGPAVWQRVTRRLRGVAIEAEPVPLLVRIFGFAFLGAACLAYGTAWAAGALGAPLVQDGGIWMRIVGTAYVVGGAIFGGPFTWLGSWLFAVGLAVPQLLPHAASACAAYAVLGGGSFLVAAAMCRRRRG